MTEKTENKGYVTANDLQKWIDHLTEDEKKLPIVISKKMFPEPDEILEPKHIGHFLSQRFDGFVIVVDRNYKSLVNEVLFGDEK